MFDRFGEFDSADEINDKADELFNAGKQDEIKMLAEENGIEECYVDMYLNGDIPMLCDTASAAVGKIDVEAKELEIGGILIDWKDHVVDMCMEDQNMQQEVRRKDKQLAECMSRLIRFAFENKVQVSNEIVDKTMITHNGKEEKLRGPLYLGVPNRKEVREMIKEYYLEDA